jgi:hypothetical protein
MNESRLQSLLASVDIQEILAAVEMDLEGVSDEDFIVLLKVAVHCCVNGPVGVGKLTTFPGVGQAKISDLVPCTNRTWRNFCRTVKRYLPEGLGGYMMERHGVYWPNE